MTIFGMPINKIDTRLCHRANAANEFAFGYQFVCH